MIHDRLGSDFKYGKSDLIHFKITSKHVFKWWLLFVNLPEVV